MFSETEALTEALVLTYCINTSGKKSDTGYRASLKHNAYATKFAIYRWSERETVCVIETARVTAAWIANVREAVERILAITKANQKGDTRNDL